MGPISEVLKRAAAHDVRGVPRTSSSTRAPHACKCSPRRPSSPQVRAEDLIEHRILGMGTFGKVRCA